jgi:hypothetical protein
MVTVAASGRTVFPLGKYRKAADVSGGTPMRPIELEWAEPGVKPGH